MKNVVSMAFAAFAVAIMAMAAPVFAAENVNVSEDYLFELTWVASDADDTAEVRHFDADGEWTATIRHFEADGGWTATVEDGCSPQFYLDGKAIEVEHSDDEHIGMPFFNSNDAPEHIWDVITDKDKKDRNREILYWWRTELKSSPKGFFDGSGINWTPDTIFSEGGDGPVMETFVGYNPNFPDRGDYFKVVDGSGDSIIYMDRIPFWEW